MTLTVRVTNTGNVAGKEAVQVYYNPPYTQTDIDMKVEKSTSNLIAFTKTEEIAAGQSVEVELSFAKEDMASYSYTRSNPDGTLGAYFLEEGIYRISLNRNAHEEYDAFDVTIPSTVWYDSDNPRQSEITGQAILDDDGNPTDVPAKAEADTDAMFIAAHNRFQSLSDHMAATSQLTRASGTLMDTATAPTAEDMANIPDGYNYSTDAAQLRPVMRPSSSHTTPNTMSVSAATMSTNHPFPAPWPKSPPLAAALMARACW